jgi:alkanesulfonate monooxygenase SsuD/methylene tetrahydromethanopterin reductase-like flavin-dependent oxidoreductase (luciferase family)
VAQHHFDASAGGRRRPSRSWPPSPFPLLAAVAERTSRIRLGTAVVTLPLEDPPRVAEDAAVLDALSGGRLELGVGSGAGPDTFAAFGKRFDSRRKDNSAAIKVLTAALTASRSTARTCGFTRRQRRWPTGPWRPAGDRRALARHGSGFPAASIRPRTSGRRRRPLRHPSCGWRSG